MIHMTISNWLLGASRNFALANIDSARLDAELILARVLYVSREFLLAHPAQKLTKQQLFHANHLAHRRTKREPLAYILSRKEFYGREFFVNKTVLIPRPESEQLIEILREVIDGSFRESFPRILDVGTGSGILAITAKLEFPAATVFASDISTAALQIARQNAENLDATVSFIKSDLLENISDKFDLILANLPYVSRNWQAEKTSPEITREPEIALFADDDGLALIKRLISQAPKNLRENSYLILEMDPRQIQAVSDFAKNYGFREVRREPFALILRLKS